MRWDFQVTDSFPNRRGWSVWQNHRRGGGRHKARSQQTHPWGWGFEPVTPTHKGALLPPFSHLQASRQREIARAEESKEPTFMIFKKLFQSKFIFKIALIQ